MRKLTPADYLAKLYSARPLFKLMFEEATSLIPPNFDGTRWTLECISTKRDIAKALGVSPGTIRLDMKRLENFGWIRVEKREGREVRVLGSQQDGVVSLMADSAALATTGVQRVVTDMLLGVKPPPVVDDDKEAPAVRGTMRQWEP